VSAADALPRYHVRSIFTIDVDAPPERALAAALAVTPREAPLLRALFALRGLRTPAVTPIWDAMARVFTPFDETTHTAVAQPWRLLQGPRRGEDFVAFAEPGWAKLAIDWRAEDGRLVTETRVLLTGERARRAFRRYWLVVRPFSALVRRSWLKAAKRRAESAAL
jgi:hypothetical protein